MLRSGGLPVRRAIIVFVVVCGFMAAWALLSSGGMVLAQDDGQDESGTSRQSGSVEDPLDDHLDEEDIGGGDEPGPNSPDESELAFAISYPEAIAAATQPESRHADGGRGFG